MVSGLAVDGVIVKPTVTQCPEANERRKEDAIDRITSKLSIIRPGLQKCAEQKKNEIPGTLPTRLQNTP